MSVPHPFIFRTSSHSFHMILIRPNRWTRGSGQPVRILCSSGLIDKCKVQHSSQVGTTGVFSQRQISMCWEKRFLCEFMSCKDLMTLERLELIFLSTWEKPVRAQSQQREQKGKERWCLLLEYLGVLMSEDQPTVFSDLWVNGIYFFMYLFLLGPVCFGFLSLVAKRSW